MKYAWDASYLTYDAIAVSKALRAARAAGHKHSKRAARRANQLQKTLDRRHSGRSKRSTILAMARDAGVRPDTVKKALQRNRRRQKISTPRKK
jgi:hypothetical protein